jgi:hypothetical protein
LCFSLLSSQRRKDKRSLKKQIRSVKKTWKNSPVDANNIAGWQWLVCWFSTPDLSILGRCERTWSRLVQYVPIYRIQLYQIVSDAMVELDFLQPF